MKTKEIEKVQGNSKKGFPFKKILKIIENIIFLIMVIISIIIMTQKFTGNEKAFLGFRIFRVQTGSMIPKYQIGDVLLVKEKPTSEIKEGEDLVYWGKEKGMQGKVITHRVVKKQIKDGKNYFYTKGIANTAMDPIVSEEQINGIVVSRLPIITFICKLLNNRFILYFLFIVPLTIYTFLAYMRAQEKKYLKRINNMNKGEK